MFEKGQKKPINSGRQSGTPNRLTRLRNSILSDAIADRREQFNQALDELFRNDKLMFARLYIQMLRIAGPKEVKIDVSRIDPAEKIEMLKAIAEQINNASEN